MHPRAPCEWYSSPEVYRLIGSQPPRERLSSGVFLLTDEETDTRSKCLSWVAEHRSSARVRPANWFPAFRSGFMAAHFPTVRHSAWFGLSVSFLCHLLPFFLYASFLFVPSPNCSAMGCLRVSRLGFFFFFTRRLLFLESTLGTLCTDGPCKCADGLIKL